jgi:hypothetical protein
MYCSSCGKLKQPGVRFCAACGSSSSGTQSALTNSATGKSKGQTASDFRQIFKVTFILALVSTVVGLMARNFNNYDSSSALDSLSMYLGFAAKILLLISYARRHYDLLKWAVFALASSLLLDIQGFVTDFYLYQLEELAGVAMVILYFIEAKKVGIKPLG